MTLLAKFRLVILLLAMIVVGKSVALSKFTG